MRSLAPALLAALVWPAPAATQSLDRVEALTHEARVQEARTELLAWFEGPGASGPAREDLQKALWYRGALTLDPAEAEMDYTRLVVEHPGGRFTDLALQRLAQAADARGELAIARRHYDVLARDYPRSPARAAARRWLDEHPVERDRTRVPDPTREPAASATGDFAVQVGAFGETERARAVAASLRAAGFEPRLVRTRPAELVRVRVGHLADAAAAETLQTRIRAAGFEAMVVNDAGRERRVTEG